MGGWKQKEESSLLVPSTFLFLYQPSVCLCVKLRGCDKENRIQNQMTKIGAFFRALISRMFRT